MATKNNAGPQAGQKTALITGAGIGGIGGALATELHEAGYFVICAVRRPSTVEELLKKGMAHVEIDVASTDSVVAAAKTVASLTNDKLDVLVNNAGVAVHRPALDLDVDGIVRTTFEVNVLGVMRVVKAFSELLINAKGCIVNIGSSAPIAPLAFSSAYNASKAAVHAYGDALRMEMLPLGVDVVTVVTGGVKSNLVRETNPSLPDDSRYLGVEKFWRFRTVVSQHIGMPTDEYARKVVKMIQRKNKPIWFWAGGQSPFAWIMYYLVPKRLKLYIMARRFGLHLLKP